MKAAVLHGREDIRVEDVPERSLAPGEIRVRIRAALTCGTDLKVYKRGYHAKMITPPALFGHEFAGEISEVHPETPGGWRAGQRVVAANSAPCGECQFCQHGQQNLCDELLFLNGAYADSIVVPARIVETNLLSLKAETAFEDAALVEPLACVAQGLHETGLQGGERVLILGAGPIGLMFAALALHAGCDVTVAGRGESRLRKAEKLGATRVIDLAGAEDLTSCLKGAGATWDIVIEAIGKVESWQAAFNVVRKGGLVNFFGGCPSGATLAVDTSRMHYSSVRLMASFHHTPAAIRQALKRIEEGVITAADFVDGQAALEELPELFRSMATGNRAVKTLVRASG